MHKELTISLQKHLVQNHPDLLIELQEQGQLDVWLTEKAGSVMSLARQLHKQALPWFYIHEKCIQQLAEGLPPSRFNYISALLEEEFEEEYFRLSEMGVMVYEVLNMMEACEGVFESNGFSAGNEDSLELYYAVTGVVKEYFDSKNVRVKM